MSTGSSAHALWGVCFIWQGKSTQRGRGGLLAFFKTPKICVLLTIRQPRTTYWKIARDKPTNQSHKYCIARKTNDPNNQHTNTLMCKIWACSVEHKNDEILKWQQVETQVNCTFCHLEKMQLLPVAIPRWHKWRNKDTVIPYSHVPPFSGNEDQALPKMTKKPRIISSNNRSYRNYTKNVYPKTFKYHSNLNLQHYC